MKQDELEKVINKAKTTLRISAEEFHEEIGDLIEAAVDTMKTRGVTVGDELRPMELRAVLTYVRLNFGQPEDQVRLKRSWDEQLAQLMTTTGYTDWGDDNGQI